MRPGGFTEDDAAPSRSVTRRLGTTPAMLEKAKNRMAAAGVASSRPLRSVALNTCAPPELRWLDTLPRTDIFR
ncbi:hypothetical protein GCM10010199_16490 [Dactylosporangium roseum]